MMAEILESAVKLVVELGFNLLSVLDLNNIDHEGSKKGD